MNDIPVDCQSQTVTEPQRDNEMRRGGKEDEQWSDRVFVVTRKRLIRNLRGRALTSYKVSKFTHLPKVSVRAR